MRDQDAGPAGGTFPVPTVGVEEEYLLADHAGGATGAAAAVLAAIDPADLTAQLKPELLTSQIEAATSPCDTTGELRAQLVRARSLVGAAAAAAGARALSVGFAPADAARPVPETEGERYAAIARLYGEVAAGYHACGCHVHVGVPDRATAVAVTDHLRPWLPVLLALSANSPFAGGRDTGCASWRAVTQGRFPGFGVPPRFGDVTSYERALERQAACGATVDARMTFWMARPSEHVPTVEVRVADALPTVDETILQAALVRGLVVRALADLAAGREAPDTDDRVAAAAVWNAARYGLDGPGVHPVAERQLPARLLLGELLTHVGEALEATGDHAEVARITARVLTHGTGARRQRDTARVHGMPAVLPLVTLDDTGGAWPVPPEHLAREEAS